MIQKTIKQLFDFTNQIVIVTGSRHPGIGYGIVLRFLTAGCCSNKSG